MISCGLKVDSLLEHKQTKKLCTVRLKFVEGPKYYIDLLFSASGVEAEVVRTSTELELLPDFFLPVATVPSLLAMKLVSVDADRRPNDVADINTLITSLNSEEYAETIVLLETITKRGLNRGRDLKGMLEDRVRLLKE